MTKTGDIKNMQASFTRRRLAALAGAILASLAPAAFADTWPSKPVKIVAQTGQRIQGVPVPSSSLMKNPANQSVVWIKTAPESFAPRVVTFEPLDGANVLVTSGLAGGERVVHVGTHCVACLAAAGLPPVTVAGAAGALSPITCTALPSRSADLPATTTGSPARRPSRTSTHSPST